LGPANESPEGGAATHADGGHDGRQYPERGHGKNEIVEVRETLAQELFRRRLAEQGNDWGQIRCEIVGKVVPPVGDNPYWEKPQKHDGGDKHSGSMKQKVVQ
jgi:hypothetical protein